MISSDTAKCSTYTPAYRILKTISPGASSACSGNAYEGKSKLAVLMGNDFFSNIAGKVVIDFGCGEGSEAIEMAARGAEQVIGIDIREDVLQTAREAAAAAGVSNCIFLTSTTIWPMPSSPWMLSSISAIPPESWGS